MFTVESEGSKMKKEHQKKALEAKKLKRAAYAKQVIPVGKHCVVRRADDWNWVIEINGDFFGYYARLPDALRALPAKLLGEADQNSLQACYVVLLGIKNDIDESLKVARLKGLL